jgi:hypothetical protein
MCGFCAVKKPTELPRQLNCELSYFLEIFHCEGKSVSMLIEVEPDER